MRNGPRFARKSTSHTSALLVELYERRWLDTDKGVVFEVRDVSPQ